MMRRFRRYEIMLPRWFNDGALVPDTLLGGVLDDLRAQFGAESCETQTIQGVWHHEGQAFRDDLVRVFVDVPDTPENVAYFVRFKEELKRRFQQIDIWMVTFPIEVV